MIVRCDQSNRPVLTFKTATSVDLSGSGPSRTFVRLPARISCATKDRGWTTGHLELDLKC